MINKKILTLLTCLVWLAQLFVISCSKSSITPPIDVDKNYLNQQILLRAPDFANSFNTTNPIGLELKYNSTNEITFPNNYNLKIFMLSKGKWISLNEEPTVRLPSGNIVFSPKKQMPAVEDIFVSPDLPDTSQKYQLRIYVTGEMKTTDGDKLVHAYADVTLRP